MIADNRRRRRKRRLPEQPAEAFIESLSDEGRGIARIDGRTVFIDQALPGEKVLFRYTRLTSKIAEGRAVEILVASPDRVEPPCAVYADCGGCSLQHMDARAQLALKQDSLLKQLGTIANVQPERLNEPITGPGLAYRGKARLGVRFVVKKGRALVGFRERASSFITDTRVCEILHPGVGRVLGEIADCIGALQLCRRIPQIEVAVGDEQTVLVIRHLDELPQTDRDALAALARRHNFTIWLQAGGPDTLEALWPAHPDTLFYRLDEFDVRIEFEPPDFTQVNSFINRRMVAAAVGFLDLDEKDCVLDLFCGLGNFTLPIARRCGSATGVEGSLAMVRKARQNAGLNNISNAEFHYADLYSEDVAAMPWLNNRYSKILLDPPRSGAAGMLDRIGAMNADRIVYVSCHPATLARDAGQLVHGSGYGLVEAGVMDMFPHTSHVESIAVFAKRKA